jgi:LemA protein
MIDMEWLIALGIIAIVVIYVIVSYNGLVKLKNWVKESWSQIDVQLKRRHDLIPNLLETVKGYAKHEQQTLEKVIQARNQLISGTPHERIEADNQLQGALKSIFALGEAYPDLKANQNFLSLQEELANSENKVAFSRQLYNKTVADYNIKRETFPSNLIAGMFNFKEEQLLVTPDEEKIVPKITF